MKPKYITAVEARMMKPEILNKEYRRRVEDSAVLREFNRFEREELNVLESEVLHRLNAVNKIVEIVKRDRRLLDIEGSDAYLSEFEQGCRFVLEDITDTLEDILKGVDESDGGA